MNDPIKIIFKYKNNNRKTQYNMYVFIGQVSPAIKKILKKIKNLTFYNALINVSAKEMTKLTKKYGTKWFKKFYNTYHIDNEIHDILENTQRQKEIIKIHGKSWFTQNIENDIVVEKPVHYSYDFMVKDQLKSLEEREKKKAEPKELEMELVNYTTTAASMTKSRTKKLYKNLTNLVGGDLESQSITPEEELNITDIENIYKASETIIDENAKATADLINKVLDDSEKIKTNKGFIEFDVSHDDTVYNAQLRDVYKKNYITSQYIFKDDTVKIIKQKISCSILNNPKFGKKSYILPFKQYLWSEYYFEESVDKVMIGHKWVKRTNLLHIDIEPASDISTYEKLDGNLKFLKSNIRKYGSKIKRQDDSSNILQDYDSYYTNNEIYMIDLYNELGTGYDPEPEKLKNLMDVYIKIYFPKNNSEDIKILIDHLNNTSTLDTTMSQAIYKNISIDLALENQIIKNVIESDTTINKKLFNKNYVTQSVIHVNLRIKDKLDLFRIFDEFIVNDKYPFVQYQTLNNQIIFKYDKEHIKTFGNEKKKLSTLTKWFENAPYGISFKVKIMENDVEKFMAINLNTNGKVEYKISWKESDKMSLEYIKNTYVHVRNLLKKINTENNKTTLMIPQDYDFKYAFINTIQQFYLPEKFIINHNDLSEFSRYFFPFVALVIEPRKRKSKTKKADTSSKYGTYLRYKRISKYENSARIEQRIIYFMRNYYFNDKSLADEIAKQFNITIDKAAEYIVTVREKYGNIKPSRRILKKLEDLAKYKPPGIQVDIQGKSRDKYKIRISGARNKDQLNRITRFVNILIYLYVETYLYKRPDKQILKKQIQSLTKVAQRRNKVEYIVNYDKPLNAVKVMAGADKQRFGFKPEKGHDQWSRLCQQSGKHIKRRPLQYISLRDVTKQGFKFDNESGTYVKQVHCKKCKNKNKGKGSNKKITIRAVGLENSEGNMIYYSCNPENNGEHTYIGFLSKGNNPFGQCMPCCFKKDQYLSVNVDKKNLFMGCLGRKTIKNERLDTDRVLGDQLYILQNTNKLQEKRFSILPYFLDFYFNKIMGNVNKISHHYLTKTVPGYYFKYGSKQSKYPYMNAIALALKTSVDKIKEKMISALTGVRSEVLFIALNDGDIKSRFKTIPKFIDYIKTSNFLPYELFNHFISIPNILLPHGLNIMTFKKVVITIEKTLEKKKIINDFTLTCEYDENNNLLNTKKKTIILVNEHINFFPLAYIEKHDVNTKKISITTTFTHNPNNTNNIIEHVLDFYNKNCLSNIMNKIKIERNPTSAKQMNTLLQTINNKKYLPRYQVIDARNKCKYIITNNTTFLPVRRSGALYNLTITKNVKDKLLPFKTMLKNLKEINKLSNNKIKTTPIGAYYDTKTSTTANVIAIMTSQYDIIPIINETINIKWLHDNGYILDHEPIYDVIDDKIKNAKLTKTIIDKRISSVNEDDYITEGYELFRMELSDYLNKQENEYIKKRIIKSVTNKKTNKKEKKQLIKKILYRLIDKKLSDLYSTQPTTYSAHHGGASKFINVTNKTPKLKNYEIKNNRLSCPIHKSKDKCEKYIHCKWRHDSCHMGLTRDVIISYINRISEELANNKLKAGEILLDNGYYVSDIVNYNNFNQKSGQEIIKSNTYNITNVLKKIFGTENIPIIGKRRLMQSSKYDILTINEENPLLDMGDYFIQKIDDTSLTIFRGYANGYYWAKQTYYDIERRNLGFYSDLQTQMANYFKSVVIDWLSNKNNNINNLTKSIADVGADTKKFIEVLNKQVSTKTNCLIEMYVLNQVYKLPIYLYDNNDKIIYLFDKSTIFDANTHSYKSSKYDKYRKKETINKSIHVKLNIIDGSNIPHNLETIYYK